MVPERAWRLVRSKALLLHLKHTGAATMGARSTVPPRKAPLETMAIEVHVQGQRLRTQLEGLNIFSASPTYFPDPLC